MMLFEFQVVLNIMPVSQENVEKIIKNIECHKIEK